MEIKVLHQVMEWNQQVGDEVRAALAADKVCMINIMGSPGAGKTSLIAGLIGLLRGRWRIGVIEGDIAGTVDAERIAALGIPAVQLDTDGACHIEAMSIRNLLPAFDLGALDVLLVENIGNLVCPAEFDIGESFRLTILSVPEGDDKVVKYPLMFTDTDCLVINKCDMLPYFDFDLDRVTRDYRGVNPNAPLYRVSSRSGDGMAALAEHLSARIAAALRA